MKVHAAEALLELKQPQGVHETFRQEHEEAGHEPTRRIVIWRVLARSAPTPAEREAWTEQIASAFQDQAGSDRLHAVESLAKLNYIVPAEQLTAFEAAAGGGDAGLALFAHWALANQTEAATRQEAVAEYLSSSDAVSRLRAAYILRQLAPLTPHILDELQRAARQEPRGSLAYGHVLSGALVAATKAGMKFEAERWRRGLVRLAVDSPVAGQRAAAAQGLAEAGTAEDLPVLNRLMDDPDADVRVYAAYATLRIIGRALPEGRGKRL